MFIFQIVAFCIQMGFWIFLAGVLIIAPDKLYRYIFNNNKYNYSYKYGYLSARGKRKKSSKIIIKIIGIVVTIPMAIFLIKPYLLDFSKLVTGNFDYITGYVTNIRTEKKDINEYV